MEYDREAISIEAWSTVLGPDPGTKRQVRQQWLYPQSQLSDCSLPPLVTVAIDTQDGSAVFKEKQHTIQRSWVSCFKLWAAPSP